MERFEAGKMYRVNGGGIIKVEKRTRCYITFSGDYSGKKMIHDFNLFGCGENIIIPKWKNFGAFCFAGHPAEVEK